MLTHCPAPPRGSDDNVTAVWSAPGVICACARLMAVLHFGRLYSAMLTHCPAPPRGSDDNVIAVWSAPGVTCACARLMAVLYFGLGDLLKSMRRMLPSCVSGYVRLIRRLLASLFLGSAAGLGGRCLLCWFCKGNPFLIMMSGRLQLRFRPEGRGVRACGKHQGPGRTASKATKLVCDSYCPPGISDAGGMTVLLPLSLGRPVCGGVAAGVD
jgi:hypothetical protein